jgi:hypothetical protein
VDINKRLYRTIVGPATVMAWLVTSGVAVGQSHIWTANTGDVRVTCPMTIGGSFEAKTTALTGHLSINAAAKALAGELAVDLKTLDTGILLRNRHMLDNYLEVQNGGDFEMATLSQIDIGALTAGITDGERPFTARLRLHGTTKAVGGMAKLTTRGTSVRVEASFPVRISEYAIAAPRHLGVGVKDEVVVHVVFLANGSSREQVDHSND